MQSLEAMSRHPDPDFRRAAAEALGDIPGVASSAALVALLGDAQASVRRAAARSLGKRGTPAVRGPLAALEDDPDPRVRQAAAAALHAIGE